MPWEQLFPSRRPPGQAVLYKAKCHEDSSFPADSPQVRLSSTKRNAMRTALSQPTAPRSGCPLQSEMPWEQLFPRRRPQVRLSFTKPTAKRTALYQPTAPMSGCPLQSELPKGQLFTSRRPPGQAVLYKTNCQKDSSLPADGPHVRLSSTKRTAKRTALYQPTVPRPGCPLQSELSKGQLFPSRWQPDQAVLYKANCHKDSSLPADGHQVRLSSTKRTAKGTALSQPMATSLGYPLQSELQRGQLFPSRLLPGQAVSSFPADGHQVGLSSTKPTAQRTALPADGQQAGLSSTKRTATKRRGQIDKQSQSMTTNNNSNAAFVRSVINFTLDTIYGCATIVIESAVVKSGWFVSQL